MHKSQSKGRRNAVQVTGGATDVRGTSFGCLLARLIGGIFAKF
jgi:hypothetical protein